MSCQPSPKRRLPAEWEPQSAVLLTWPHAQTDWGEDLPEVEATFFAIAVAVCRQQNLVVSCQNFSQLEDLAERLFQAGVPAERVKLYCVPSNDSWVRDHGPITIVEDGEPTLLDFKFNAWGGKYACEKDNVISRSLEELGAFEDRAFREVDYILEGGAIDSDGQGRILTTTTCLLSATRNADPSRQQVAERLSQVLGDQEFLWLSNGYLAGDDTDSHIDTLARFCDEQTICYVACQNPGDEHYPALKAMKEELEALRQKNGAPYRLVALPMPEAQYGDEGERLPATYANFLIINNAVLVPIYDCPQDALALGTMKTLFPNRQIEAIDCRSLIRQHGSLHCVTMQLPQGVIA